MVLLPSVSGKKRDTASQSAGRDIPSKSYAVLAMRVASCNQSDTHIHTNTDRQADRQTHNTNTDTHTQTDRNSTNWAADSRHCLELFPGLICDAMTA